MEGLKISIGQSYMKTIILCGGIGSRMKEETEFKPKPMVLIGGKPMLWHIMKLYSHFGFNDFILALGYKGDMIKQYFLNQKFLLNDCTLDLALGTTRYDSSLSDSFTITFADTGPQSETGERIGRVARFISEDSFMLTYGDGIGDVNIKEVIDFHNHHGKLATITGVHPQSRYGLVKINHTTMRVEGFYQKPIMHDYVSGGFMVFQRDALKYFDSGPMEEGLVRLSQAGELYAYGHNGYWRGMDTYREVEELNAQWKSEKPWALWESKTSV